MEETIATEAYASFLMLSKKRRGAAAPIIMPFYSIFYCKEKPARIAHKK